MAIINAFHPDYIKTHQPEMLIDRDSIGREKASRTLSKFVTKKRKKEPTWGFAGDLSKAKKVSLSPKEFLVFSRAGTKNTKVKS